IHVISIVSLWALVLGGAMILQRASIIVMTRAGESVQFDLRRHMFTHLQRLSMSFYDRTKLGRIISRCTSDISSLREVNVWGIDQPLLNFIGIVGHVIILLFGRYLIASGRLKNVGAVVAAFLYWDWFMNPIIDFGAFSNLLLQAMAGAERIFSLLDTAPDVQDLPGAYPLPPVIGKVIFDNVTFGY